MNFVDKATVDVFAGKGGNGAVSFRHEKFVDRGGPDGGDGGRGGSVVFVASRNQNTLMNFRFQKELAAQDGQNGSKKKRAGRRGKDMQVAVPVGTVVYEDGCEIVDLKMDGQSFVVANGGRGGFGNAHFISSVRQAPKFAEPGEDGEKKSLSLELKLIADVGLVGLPNAGKSTLISVVSNAKPTIADYPFTTITPNLGVVDIENGQSMLLADIPGLIEGAARGKGLGDEFLRHVERTAVLIHLIDVNSVNIVEDYKTIQKELAEYDVDLSLKPQIVALSKVDNSIPELVAEAKAALEPALPEGVKLYEISSQAHLGTRELMYETFKLVQAERQSQMKLTETETPNEEEIPVLSLEDSQVGWTVEQDKSGYRVFGPDIDKFSTRTDFSNDESVQRLKAIMRKKGILHELSRQGATTSAKIMLKSGSFEL